MILFKINFIFFLLLKFLVEALRGALFVFWVIATGGGFWGVKIGDFWRILGGGFLGGKNKVGRGILDPPCLIRRI